MLVLYLPWGFLCGYLMTRTFLTATLSAFDLDRIRKGITEETVTVVTEEVVQRSHAQDVNDVEALAISNRFMRPGFNPNPDDEALLKEALRKASPVVREQIFLEASAQRSKNWDWRSVADEDPSAADWMKRLHDCTIPIFRSLRDSFSTDSRFHGELGFALKDQGEPAPQEALAELEEAIVLCRDKGESSWYYLSRGLVLITIQSLTRDGSLTPLIEESLQRAAQANSTVAKTVRNDPAIHDWKVALGRA
jgi:hypothetical protein